MINMEPAKVWNPSMGGRIYNAIGHILDVLNTLYKSTKGEIQYLIGIKQDMFIPLMLYMETHDTSDDHMCEDNGEGAPIEKLLPTKAFHEGMLPDNISDLMKCSFWSDNGKMEPIVHLLSKSTPQRCQIRSLTLIMLNYCKMHDNVYDFVVNALKCSMLGAYRGCKRPSIHIRKNIRCIRQYVSQRVSHLYAKPSSTTAVLYYQRVPDICSQTYTCSSQRVAGEV